MQQKTGINKLTFPFDVNLSMETELFASKQCDLIQDDQECRNPAGSFQEKFVYFTALRNCSSTDHCCEDEPIDLSNYNRDRERGSGSGGLKQGFPSRAPQQQMKQDDIRENFEPRLEAQPFQIVDYAERTLNIPSEYYLPKPKRKKRKFVYTPEGKLLLVTDDHQTATAFTPAKQQEILNAAKALFSKRTRTLYHWMYPNAAKQQIKTVIANSWDSLEDREKEFYISQVLGRFGFPQTNLMINPQLGTIKHLPPPPAPSAEGGEREWAAAPAPVGTDATERGGARRRGRPKGHAGKRAASRDFQDDPELSLELEKFAMTFNLSSVV